MAILVAAGCNVREVSEWAGHNSVAFTLTRYGGLFEDGSEAAVDRLDTVLGGGSKDSDNVLQMDTRKTEVSPERVPEPILTARPDQHKHFEEAFRLVSNGPPLARADRDGRKIGVRAAPGRWFGMPG